MSASSRDDKPHADAETWARYWTYWYERHTKEAAEAKKLAEEYGAVFTPSHELQITQAAGESADAVLHEKDASGMESSREGGKPSAPSTTPQKPEAERDALRHGQALAVVPLVGNVLTHWESLPNDLKDHIREIDDGLEKAIDAVQDAMENHEPASAASAIAPKPASLLERTAQIAAHRACCGTEHDPANGKLHGCCVVCGVPWPCKFAGKEPAQGIAFDPISGEPYRYAPPAVTPQKGKLVADWHECRTCGAQILGGAHREPDNSSDGGKQTNG